MDVAKLTPEQTRNILDFVLKNSYHPKDYWDIKEDLLKHEEYFPNRDEPLLKMALNKLKEDGLIDFFRESEDKKTQFVITDRYIGEQLSVRRNFNGHLFLANGGYSGEEKRKITAAQENKDALERGEGYASGLQTWTKNLAERTGELTFWTRLVAIGAIGLVVWEIVAYILEHSC